MCRAVAQTSCVGASLVWCRFDLRLGQSRGDTGCSGTCLFVLRFASAAVNAYTPSVRWFPDSVGVGVLAENVRIELLDTVSCRRGRFAGPDDCCVFLSGFERIHLRWAAILLFKSSRAAP